MVLQPSADTQSYSERQRKAKKGKERQRKAKKGKERQRKAKKGKERQRKAKESKEWQRRSDAVTRFYGLRFGRRLHCIRLSSVIVADKTGKQRNDATNKENTFKVMAKF